MCHNIKGSLHEISPHRHLTTLDLEQCDVDGDLAALTSLLNMERLRLNNCFKIDGDLGEWRSFYAMLCLSLFGDLVARLPMRHPLYPAYL